MKSFALPIVSLSAVVYAVSSVPRCLRTKKLKDDGRYLVRGEAICDFPYAFGISDDGTFGLWKDGNIIREIATDASVLQVTDSNREVYMSVYNAKKSLIW